MILASSDAGKMGMLQTREVENNPVWRGKHQKIMQNGKAKYKAKLRGL